eukprot:gene26090-31955_t
MLAAELAEYTAENLESFAQFSCPDSQECVELLEARKNGILPLLDEQCGLPKAIFSLNGNHPNLSKPNKLSNHLGTQFIVSHYAGEVTYNTGQCIEKNRDYIPAEFSTVLARADNAVLAEMFQSDCSLAEREVPHSAAPARGGKRLSVMTGGMRSKYTVSNAVCNDLTRLLDQIHNANCHFVHCVKPNAWKKAGVFARGIVLEQLQSTGLMDTVRVQRLGYPYKYYFDAFMERYRLLLPRGAHASSTRPAELCVHILMEAGLPP